MSQKRKREPATDLANDGIFRSEPVEDRSSSFKGYYSPSLSPSELQRLPEIESASHKLLAWRKAGKQQTLTAGKACMDTGHDDDGEKYGGKRVEQVLANMQVQGACVVARWYGGVLLGPVRFAHIETCAREAIRQWQEHDKEETLKKQKVEDDAVEKKTLVVALAQRDQSISVLRTLAGQKETTVKQAFVEGVNAMIAEGDAQKEEGPKAVESSTCKATPAPTPAIDYAAMSTERLRSLDKARDATVAFLLKRIQKAEADLAALEAPNEPP